MKTKEWDFWTVGLLRIPKKCEGGEEGGAKEVATSQPPSHPPFLGMRSKATVQKPKEWIAWMIKCWF